MFKPTLAVLFLVGLALGAYGLPSRIVGGNDAAIGKYPYQVSLRQYGSHFCGGSIINQRYIITAAHCVQGANVRAVTVHVGTNYLNQNGDSYNAERIVYHAGYDSYQLINDIAVVRVSRNIQFSTRVQPISYARTNFVTTGSPCVATGWGATRTSGSLPNKLQELNLVVESQQRCRTAHSNLRDSHICTFLQYGKGMCNGDSGGPLVSNGVLIGIVSFGRPCAVGYPDVFTRVSYFSSWIQNNSRI